MPRRVTSVAVAAGLALAAGLAFYTSVAAALDCRTLFEPEIQACCANRHATRLTLPGGDCCRGAVVDDSRPVEPAAGRSTLASASPALGLPPPAMRVAPGERRIEAPYAPRGCGPPPAGPRHSTVLRL